MAVRDPTAQPLHQSLHQGYTRSVDELRRPHSTSESLQTALTASLCGNGPLLLATPGLSRNRGRRIVLEVLVLVTVTLVLVSGNPESRLPVVEGLVLVGEVNTLLVVASGILAALRKSAGALR